VCAHRDDQAARGELERRRVARLVTEVHDRVVAAVSREVAAAENAPDGRALLAGLRAGTASPAEVVDRLLSDVRRLRDADEEGA
jgi:hypothetical protein